MKKTKNENKKSILNKKSITIYTIILYIISILLFEVGYCNSQVIRSLIVRNESFSYCVSICRIVMYILIFILYMALKNKFINEAIDVTKSKLKRILIYLSVIGVIFSIVATIIVYIVKPELTMIRAMSIAGMAALATSILIIYVSNNIEKNVIVICATLGIIFTFTSYFNHTLDEKRHFMSAFNLSFFNLNYDGNPITDKKIADLPHLSKFTTIDEYQKESYKPEIIKNTDKEDVGSTPAGYNIIFYIMPAIGITIARLLGGTIIDMYILGRIFNLILYAILVLLAIKITPIKKNILFVVSMIPYILLLAASFSIDGTCLGIIFIFIAYCLKLYKEDKPITLKKFLVLVLVFVLLLLIKSMAYLFVGLIVLILPIKKTLKENKKYLPIIIMCAIVSIIVITILAVYVKNTHMSSDSRAEGEVSVEKQMHLILTNPVHDIKLIISHMENSILNFGWLSEAHPTLFFKDQSKTIALIMLFYLFYIGLTEDDFNLKIKDKIILLISFFAVYAMTSAVLYLTFTPVGTVGINGYQVRYVIPLIPLTLMCLSSGKIKNTQKNNRNINIALFSSAILVVSVLELILV